MAVAGPTSGSGMNSIAGHVYELDSSSTLPLKKSFTIPTKPATQEVRAMAGLLTYDLALGYDVNRRQLAVAYLATVAETPAL